MKIEKIFQGQIPENKIMNDYTETNTDAYSCEYINNTLKGNMLFQSNDGVFRAVITGLSNYKFLDIEIRTVVYGRKQIKRMYLDTTDFKENVSFVFLAYGDMIQTLMCDIEYNGFDTLELKDQRFTNATNNVFASMGTIDRMRITKIIGYK